MLNYYVRDNRKMKDVMVIIDVLRENGVNTVSDLWNILTDKRLFEGYQNGKITVFDFIKQMFGVKAVVNQLQVPYTTSMKNI